MSEPVETVRLVSVEHADPVYVIYPGVTVKGVTGEEPQGR